MLWTKRVGIDLGTANSLVYIEKRGIVLQEPTVVAYSLLDKRIVAVGNEAKEMIGRTPGTLIASRPMKNGVIAQYSVTKAMIEYFLAKTVGFSFIKPEVLITIPGGATQVERRAVSNACMSAGARAVYLIEEPLAAAIGAKLSIANPTGSMIINIGGGTTEAAVISLGELVSYKSERVGGDSIEEYIISYLRKKHALIIGDRTAEELKIAHADAYVKETSEEPTIEVKGRDMRTGLPKRIELSERELSYAIATPLRGIVATVKRVLEDIPPELSADIVERGAILSGGTSLLKNIDRYLSEEVGIPCMLSEDPLFCVIRGLGTIAEHFDLYKRASGK